MPAGDSALRERVARAAARVLPEVAAAAAGSLVVEPLGGGVGQRSCRLAIGGRSWAVRVAGRRPEGALDLAVEAGIAAAAAAADLSPAVVGCDAVTGVLVTEYREGAHALTPELARAPAAIERLARLLRRLHALALRARPFEPQRFAAGYLEVLGGLAALPAPQRRLGAELESEARVYARRYPGSALCHNDLVASNVLDDGRLWLIDFEYAVSAAPILDLAGLAALNGYDADQRQSLAAAYYGADAVPFGSADLDRVVRLIRLLAYFWALAAARSAEDAEPYARFAEHSAAQLI